MAKNVFKSKHFHSEEAARQWFEKARWPQGPNCPKCGTLEPYTTKKTGVYRCRARECRAEGSIVPGMA